MMTALYVFIGILAAALVIYILNQFVGFVRKIKRKLDENNVTNRVCYAPPRTLYNSYYGMYGPYGPNFDGLTAQRLNNIQDKLDDLDNKIDQLLEDTGELMLAKERPEE
jgi:hypothetical protein